MVVYHEAMREAARALSAQYSSRPFSVHAASASDMLYFHAHGKLPTAPQSEQDVVFRSAYPDILLLFSQPIGDGSHDNSKTNDVL